jgi:hypothetical protein
MKKSINPASNAVLGRRSILVDSPMSRPGSLAASEHEHAVTAVDD